MTPHVSTKLPCLPEEADEFLSAPLTQVVESLAKGSGNYLVLGAGGKMGFHVCRMLRRGLDEGGLTGRVIAVSRFGNPADRADFESAGIETLAADLSTPVGVESVEPEENVIFMAGAKFGTSGRPDILQKMNVEMPQLVAEYFHRSRITAFSTGCVYSFVPADSSGSTEDAPTNPVGEYAMSCLGREQAFRAASLRHATKVMLIRLNYAVEFRYGVLVDIAAKVLRGEPVDVGTGRVNLIWQRDAIAHTIQAHALAASPALPINITGPRSYKVRDLAERFGKIFGRTPTFSGEEAEEIWLADASRSHELFGLPPIELDLMIDWVAAWLAGGHPILGKPTGFEKRDGKF